MMAYGNYEGKEMSDPELRKYFERNYVINSAWYKARLKLKQQKDINFYKNQISYLERFISNAENKLLVKEMDINNRLQNVKKLLKIASSISYIKSLEGTIGADPLFRK
jgi:hypothetical protein